MSLTNQKPRKPGQTPLAEQLRPETLDQFVGQKQLLGSGQILGTLISGHTIPSMIFWGPPGTGKTSLAKIISHNNNAHFVYFSAVLSGVKEVRTVVEAAQQRRAEDATGTIFFIDEIHRFHKGQQDALLPHVENGLFTLIGATTENPSFQIIAPLLSRCQIFVLQPLSADEIKSILTNALNDSRGYGGSRIQITGEALTCIASNTDGDARKALNILEISISLQSSALNRAHEITIDRAAAILALQEKSYRYDHHGDHHYDQISALHKSLRDSDPDGALYWFYRMILAGENPQYISRRLLRFASEDIGLADPHALIQAQAGWETYHKLGSPEGELALAQVVVYLATAPKSNALYKASRSVKQLVRKTGSLPVPLHLRNAPTQLMKDLDYGKGYQYSHDSPDGLVEQSHLPEALEKQHFYAPTTRGYESIIKDRLDKWRQLLQRRTKGS